MSRRLDSWKEIASYLGRGVRTVQRWEREEGLPVHRLAHAERGSVYADANELTAWWESRRIKPDAKPALEADAVDEPRLHRVTNTTAATFWPALSSDARMVVYVSDAGKDGVSPQVWLQQIGGAAVQLTTGFRDCAEPSFSADDTRVIFSAWGDSSQNVYEIPALGGSPRLFKRAARSARFSPDGKWLAYIAIEPIDTVRLAPAAGGSERVVATGLVNISTVTWAHDGRRLLLVGHPNSLVDLDCWVTPIDGGAPVDTGVMRRARQRGFIVIATMPVAWAGDSIFYSAAGRQGLHVWRQRVSAETCEAIGEPEQMTPGSESAFFPAAAGGRLSYVGTHTDTNVWSAAIDPATGRAHGSLRRLTRGIGIVSHFSLSRDGRTLAYFAARTIRGELRVRDLDSGADTIVEVDLALNCGFPAISPDGRQIAFGAMVPGPPLERPVFLANLAAGETRLVSKDCGGRPRQWLDERMLLVETFGSGLNNFALVDTRDGTQRPLLSSVTRRVSNPRVSNDGRWLAFDATRPGGSPSVAIAPLDENGGTGPESAWMPVQDSASHAFWSRDGRLLYFLPTLPSADIRNRVAARRFDPSDGRVADEQFDVLTLSEMIVPAMVSAVAPIVAPGEIIFVLGDFRGDVWIMNV
jgi:Tol biopolymer transport system component